MIDSVSSSCLLNDKSWGEPCSVFREFVDFTLGLLPTQPEWSEDVYEKAMDLALIHHSLSVPLPLLAMNPAPWAFPSEDEGRGVV